MQFHLVSSIVSWGIAAAVTGCASMESFNRTMIVDDAARPRLERQPANGVMSGTHEYSPTYAVQSTITDVLSILGNEALKQPARSEERRRHLEEIIRHRVSYEQMAQRALGASWKQLNATEREEFVQ